MLADEFRHLDAVRDQLPAAEETIARVLRRIPALSSGASRRAALGVGAAHGMSLLALNRAGYDASGVEPWSPETGQQLA